MLKAIKSKLKVFKYWFFGLSKRKVNIVTTDDLVPSKPKDVDEQRKDFEDIISSRANNNCPACFGRGHVGLNVQNKMYVPCNCVNMNVQKEMAQKYKSKTNIIIPN